MGIKTKIQVNKDSAGLDTVVEIFGKDCLVLDFGLFELRGSPSDIRLKLYGIRWPKLGNQRLKNLPTVTPLSSKSA